MEFRYGNFQIQNVYILLVYYNENQEAVIFKRQFIPVRVDREGWIFIWEVYSKQNQNKKNDFHIKGIGFWLESRVNLLNLHWS